MTQVADGCRDASRTSTRDLTASLSRIPPRELVLLTATAFRRR